MKSWVNKMEVNAPPKKLFVGDGEKIRPDDSIKRFMYYRGEPYIIVQGAEDRMFFYFLEDRIVFYEVYPEPTIMELSEVPDRGIDLERKDRVGGRIAGNTLYFFRDDFAEAFVLRNRKILNWGVGDVEVVKEVIKMFVTG